MPITSSAKKALRSSKRKRVYNIRKKNLIDTAIKNLKKAISVKNEENAKKALSAVYKTIDKVAKTDFIKKNTASRKKSRLAALVRKAFSNK